MPEKESGKRREKHEEARYNRILKRKRRSNSWEESGKNLPFHP
jgi:hypothetical protein